MESSCTETSSDESVLTKAPEKKFDCKFVGCIATFSKARKLINHQRRHTGERPFVCEVPECGKTYTNSSHLRRHTKTHTGTKERVTCHIIGCLKEFYDQFGLRRHHERVHNNDRTYNYPCLECKQGFHKKKQLQQHTYLHTGQLPFKCTFCETKCATMRDLNRHKRTHTTYSCDCAEVFERWTALLKHRKICPQTAHKCATCQKQFSSLTNLKLHQNVHVDDANKDVFICPKEGCDRHYFYKKNLIHHIKSIHEDNIVHKSFPCPIEGCSSVLKLKKNLLSHIETHKNKRPRKLIRAVRKDIGAVKKSVAYRLINPVKSVQNNEISNDLIVGELPQPVNINAKEVQNNDINAISDDLIVELPQPVDNIDKNVQNNDINAISDDLIVELLQPVDNIDKDVHNNDINAISDDLIGRELPQAVDINESAGGEDQEIQMKVLLEPQIELTEEATQQIHADYRIAIN